MSAYIHAKTQGQNDRDYNYMLWYMLWLYGEFHRLMFSTAGEYIPDPAGREAAVRDCLASLSQRVPELRKLGRGGLAYDIVSAVRNASMNYSRRQEFREGRAAGAGGSGHAETESERQKEDHLDRHEQLRKQYEDALSALLTADAAEAEGKQLLEENERLKADPAAAIPDEVNDRCVKTIRRAFARARRRAAGRTAFRVLRGAGIAAAVCALLFAAALAASPELREKTLDFLIEVSVPAAPLTPEENRTDPDRTDSDGAGDYFYGYRLPEIPEGFTVDYQGGSRDSGYIQYINEDDATILFDIFKTTAGDEYVIDTENAEVTDIRIHGYEGLLIEKRYEFDNGLVIDSVGVVWADTDQSRYILVLGNNVEKEIILELAEGVEFVNVP